MQHTLFLNGDSGYFDGFKLIGERYGPFDLTMMETGGYDKDWADVVIDVAKSENPPIRIRTSAWSENLTQLKTLSDPYGFKQQKLMMQSIQ